MTIVSHRSSAVVPATSAVAAMAPAFTMGLVRPSALRSTAATELNARPVALTPRRERASVAPMRAHTRANTNGLATLMIVKGTRASPTS